MPNGLTFFIRIVGVVNTTLALFGASQQPSLLLLLLLLIFLLSLLPLSLPPSPKPEEEKVLLLPAVHAD